MCAYQVNAAMIVVAVRNVHIREPARKREPTEAIRR